MMESALLSQGARASVRSTFDQDTAHFGRELRAWEASSDAFLTNGTVFSPEAWAGIHARMIAEFGWNYLLRYARAWKSDPTVRAMLELDDVPPDSVYVPVKTERTATFAAAAVSAAVQSDLRTRFIDWRFPVIDSLFTGLFDHWLTAMDDPWPDARGASR